VNDSAEILPQENLFLRIRLPPAVSLMRTVAITELAAVAWNRKFESISLQQRVGCEPEFRGRIPENFRVPGLAPLSHQRGDLTPAVFIISRCLFL
jgi:hypothetical protein